MMSHGDQLKNPLFRNWVRGALALKYLKQGLVDHVDQSIKTQHLLLIKKCTVTGATSITCGLCTLDNVLPEHSGERCKQKTRSKCFCSSTTRRRKCPVSHCSLFMDMVIEEHWLKDPIWRNSDPTKWLSEYWQYAKCFLSTFVKNCVDSAQNADASDLLSISINNTSMRNRIQNIDDFIKARQTRNKILHSASYELTDSELHDDIQTCIDVLLDKTVIQQVSAQKAVKDLKQLKNKQIRISSEDVKDVEEMRTKALNEIEERKEIAIQSIDAKVQLSLDELNRKAGMKLDDFHHAWSSEKMKACQEFKEETETIELQVVNCIKNNTNECITYLNEMKNDINCLTENKMSEFTKVLSDQVEEKTKIFLLEIEQYTKAKVESARSKLEEERDTIMAESVKENILKQLKEIELKHSIEIKEIQDKVYQEIKEYLTKKGLILDGKIKISTSNSDQDEIRQHLSNPGSSENSATFRQGARETLQETVEIIGRVIKKSSDYLTYKNKQTTMTYFNLIIVDREGSIHSIRSYQIYNFSKMKIGLTFKFGNLIKKTNGFWMTKNSSIHYTEPITTKPPEQLPLLPEEEPKPGQKRSLKDTLGTNVRSTIKVKVIEVSPIKMCKEGTLPVRILGVKDQTGSARVCLYSEKATTSFRRHDLIELSSVYPKAYDKNTTLCASRETTLQFLSDDHEINIDGEDLNLFVSDFDFASEDQKVEVTITDLCRVSVYRCCKQEGCRSKGFVEGACPLCKSKEGNLTCRTEVMFKTENLPLKKAVLFRQELEAVIGQKLQSIDEDDIITFLVSLLPITFHANVSAQNKFKNVTHD